MRLDGFGLMVKNMSEMIRFYRDVLGFEIKEKEDATHVYLIKDNTLFMLYGREDFEKMTGKRYEYIGKGLNGHFEIAYMSILLKRSIKYTKKPFPKEPSPFLNPQRSLGDKEPVISQTPRIIL